MEFKNLVEPPEDQLRQSENDLSLHLCSCIPVSPPVFLSLYLCTCIPVSPPVFLSLYLCSCLSTCVPVYLSHHLCSCLSTCVPAEVGWRMDVKPKSHPVNQLEFDVIIGADGRRNTLPGTRQNLSPEYSSYGSAVHSLDKKKIRHLIS